MNILHLDASAREYAVSHARRLSDELVDHLRTATSEATVIYRDLAATPQSHIDTTIRDSWAAEGERDASLDKLAVRSKNLVAELQEVSTVIIWTAASERYRGSLRGTDVSTIRAERVAYGSEQDRVAMEQANAQKKTL